jgi:hypothetical protein
VTSTILFATGAAISAAGSGNSLYTNPCGDWACTWGNRIALTKASDEIPTVTLTVHHTGNGSVTLDQKAVFMPSA